ncbi:ABC transporter permease [Paenibacillus sp. N3.4]|uniref:ABC transporter permease n=1 Tax=Paenibacillus sp. N3.4 TaxID=2603222 RepID=UPI0011C88623|nr:ABC transporter permease [Paenibacillus sp. N3.4]TXK84842.1 ABC transporter permease [Paenibacillus sp. N3.4]
MLGAKLASWMVFAGVLLMVASAGLLSSVITDWEQTNGSHQLNKLAANVDTSVAATSTTGLTLQDAEKLAKVWNTQITYSAGERGNAKAGINKANCHIIGVNEYYRDFTHMRMIAGTTITLTSVGEHSRVAVISAKVSDQLYHSVQVVGKTIELWGVPFTVIGVFYDHDSLIKQMAGDGIPDVLIPVTTMLDIRPELKIINIELAAKSDAALGGRTDVQHALTAIGQNPTQFRIDNNISDHTWIAQQKSLLLFIYGIIAVYLCLRFVPSQMSIVYARLKSRLVMENWQDALNIERTMLVKHGLVVICLIAVAAILWKWIAFQLYIPPDWIPEEIIDLPFYMDKLRNLWQQNILLAGYLPSSQEALTAAAGKLTGWLLITGVVMGLPLFLLGVRMWAITRIPLLKQLVILLFFVPAATAITFAAARWAGMDYLIDLRDITVSGVLFTVTAVYFQNQKTIKGVLMNNEENHD